MTDSDTIAARIAESLREDREEGLLYGETVASPAAVRVCQTVAAAMMELLADPPAEFKWEAFGEEGGAALVLRSSKTDRRVDFLIRTDKPDIVNAVFIDEGMNARTVPVAVGHVSMIRYLAEWVAGG